MSSDDEMGDAPNGHHPNSPLYDPDVPQNIQREQRRAYRDEAERLAEHAKNPMGSTLDVLEESYRRTDKVFGGVKNTAEALQDSHVQLQAANLMLDLGKKLRSAGGFELADFLGRLRTCLGTQADDDDDGAPARAPRWENVARHALARSCRVPAMDFMLGPFDVAVKERVVKKRGPIEKSKAVERRPQELTEQDVKEAASGNNETSAQVKVVQSLVRERARINLFRLIVHPGSFAQSVENLFYLSFVIREGWAGLEIAPDGEPFICARTQADDDDYARGVKKKQIVLSLDMATWKRAIEVYNIMEPTVPNRAAPLRVDGPAGAWY